MFTASDDIAAVVLAPERNGSFWANQAAQRAAVGELAGRVSSDLGLGSNPEIVADGLFKDAYVFRQPSEGRRRVPFLVGTYALFERAASQPFASVFIQAELPSCYLINAQIIWRDRPPAFEQEIPAALQGKPPLRPPAEKLQVTHSPVRLSFRGNQKGGAGGAAEALNLSRILGEAYAAAQVGAAGMQFPLRSELLAKACAFFARPFATEVPGEGQPSYRVHRDLVSTFSEQGKDIGVFPAAGPACALRSAPFSHAVPTAIEQLGEPRKEFSPRACLDAFLGALQRSAAAENQTPQAQQELPSQSLSLVQELALDSYEVVSRNGRHVTLKSGRTSGLVLGSRLVGPSGERLHVIRLLRSGDSLDSAIAFIRKENEKSPIAPGFKLSLDKRMFPLGAKVDSQ